MKLFIHIKDGQPSGHPILESNFKQAFPKIDINNLPDDYAEFKRVASPELGVYQVNDGVSYQWDGDIVKDVWSIRDMTEEEKIEKQNQIKSDWEQNGFASWIFNEETCEFKPPIEKPDDENIYEWNEETVSWTLIGPKPTQEEIFPIP